MVIDNFSLIRPHLEFSKAFSADGRELGGSFDRYVINVLKRAKDCGGKRFGSNEGSRLIATFVVSNLEYFDSKADRIRDLCRSNGARAYILPQPRSSRDCLAEMIRIAVNSIDDPSVNLSHLVKTATCGNHRSRRKTFVFDLDSEKYNDDDSVVFFSEIRDIVGESGRNAEDVYVVPTPNGRHIVSPAFDRGELVRRCPKVNASDIKADAMTLLFFDGDFAVESRG